MSQMQLYYRGRLANVQALYSKMGRENTEKIMDKTKSICNIVEEELYYAAHITLLCFCVKLCEQNFSTKLILRELKKIEKTTQQFNSFVNAVLMYKDAQPYGHLIQYDESFLKEEKNER